MVTTTPTLIIIVVLGVLVAILVGCCLFGRQSHRALPFVHLQQSTTKSEPIYFVSGANVSRFDGHYFFVASSANVPEHWKQEHGGGYLIRLTDGGWALVFSSPNSLNWKGSALKHSLDWKTLDGNAHAYTTSKDPTASEWNEWKKGAYSVRNLRLVNTMFSAKDGCGPLASECRKHPKCAVEDEGKFCPPDAPGGSDSADGYCCVDGEWKAGNCCQKDVDRKEPPSFIDEVCTWVGYADTFKSSIDCLEGDAQQCSNALEELVEYGLCENEGMSKACEIIETLAKVKSDANLAADLNEFKKLLEDGEEGGVGVAVDAAELACRSRGFVKDAMSLFGGCSVDCAKDGKVCAGGQCRVCTKHDFDNEAKCGYRDNQGKLHEGFCREKDGDDKEVWDCHNLKPLRWGCDEDADCQSGHCRPLDPRPNNNSEKFCTQCGKVGTECGGGRWCREKDEHDHTVWDCHPCKPSGWGAGSGDSHLKGSVCCSGEVVKTDNCNWLGNNCDYKCK